MEVGQEKKNCLIKNLKNLTFKCLYNIFHQWGKKLLEKRLNFFIALVRTISQKLYLLHKKSKKTEYPFVFFFQDSVQFNCILYGVGAEKFLNLEHFIKYE